MRGERFEREGMKFGGSAAVRNKEEKKKLSIRLPKAVDGEGEKTFFLFLAPPSFFFALFPSIHPSPTSRNWSFAADGKPVILRAKLYFSWASLLACFVVPTYLIYLKASKGNLWISTRP